MRPASVTNIQVRYQSGFLYCFKMASVAPFLFESVKISIRSMSGKVTKNNQSVSRSLWNLRKEKTLFSYYQAIWKCGNISFDWQISIIKSITLAYLIIEQASNKRTGGHFSEMVRLFQGLSQT